MNSDEELKWIKIVKAENARRAAGIDTDDDFEKLFSSNKKKKRAKFANKGFMQATAASKLAGTESKIMSGPLTQEQDYKLGNLLNKPKKVVEAPKSSRVESVEEDELLAHIKKCQQDAERAKIDKQRGMYTQTDNYL